METNTPSVSIISCMYFLRRGVAKPIPEKVELTEQELEEMISRTKEELRLTAAGDDVSDDDDQAGPSGMQPLSDSLNDEFDFSNYDNEDEPNPASLENVAILPNPGDLGEGVRIRVDGPDSDEEDDVIKPDDNLLIVGHVETDASILEIYIYNKAEGSFYVHHDLILPWFPLCIEWLSHDPSDDKPGNLVALGGMDPLIHVWDIDIENCLEPAFSLGKKPNRPRRTKRVGHRDAVLDLSWNTNFTHVIASGSADSTVLLWDIDTGTPHTKMSYFGDKVQTLSFHPLEPQTLATGACDGHVRVIDCRSPALHKHWQLPPEIERVAWDTRQPYCFAMSNNEGKVAYVDCRQDDVPVWTINAHEKEVTGLILSDTVPGLMITVGTDEKVKTWDIMNLTGGVATPVSERACHVGKALCAAACPDAPLVIAMGGDNRERHLDLIDLAASDQVMNRFSAQMAAQGLEP